MRKRLFLLSAILITHSTIFSQTQSLSNSSREIELYRIQNIKSGKNGDDGLLNHLTFSFENFQLFEKHSAEIQNSLKNSTSIEQFIVRADGQKCEVFYPLKDHSTDDFLRIFKEMIGGYKVLLSNYQEELLIKNND
jgi:hypothetical protein